MMKFYFWWLKNCQRVKQQNFHKIIIANSLNCKNSPEYVLFQSPFFTCKWILVDLSTFPISETTQLIFIYCINFKMLDSCHNDLATNAFSMRKSRVWDGHMSYREPWYFTVSCKITMYKYTHRLTLYSPDEFWNLLVHMLGMVLRS